MRSQFWQLYLRMSLHDCGILIFSLEITLLSPDHWTVRLLPLLKSRKVEALEIRPAKRRFIARSHACIPLHVIAELL
jgi:hypothetical protein